MSDLHRSVTDGVGEDSELLAWAAATNSLLWKSLIPVACRWRGVRWEAMWRGVRWEGCEMGGNVEGCEMGGNITFPNVLSQLVSDPM